MAALLYFLVAPLCVLVARRVALLSWRVGAALVLLPLCFTGRALLTGRVYAPLDLMYVAEPLAGVARQVGITHVANPRLSDVAAQFIPWNAALRDAVRHGELPLWNRFELAGDPLAGAAQSAPYHPVTLLALLVPLADGLTFTAAMTLLLAALSMFLFLRALELDEVPALFGAAAWAFSTGLVSFLLTAHALAIAVAPLLFLGGRLVARAPSLRSGAVLTAALVLATLAGHPETELHAVTMAAAYMLFEMSAARGEAKRALVVALAAGATALLLCAIHLGPMLEAIPQTREFLHRAGGWRMHAPLAQLPHLLSLNFVPFAEEAVHSPHEWAGTTYAGAVLFAPALAALFVRRREVWFFAALVVFAWLAGAEAPGVSDVLRRLPLFNIAVNARLIAFGALGICVLAAMGAAAAGRRRASRRDAGAPLLVFGALAMAMAAMHLPLVEAPAMRELIPLLLAAALVAAFPNRGALALLALLLVQRTAEAGAFVPTLDRRAAEPPLPQLRALARQPEPFRVAALGPLLTPNVATLFGLEDVRGYQAMTFAPLAETFPLWSTPQAVWSNRVDDASSPMLSLMNVRYVLTPSGIIENRGALPRAFVPRVVHVGPRAGSVEELASCRDFGAEAWIASRESPYTRQNGEGDVGVRRDGARLLIHAVMRGPGWIVVSEPAWRGWRATTRGRAPLRLHVADHAFLAFYLPAGESDVRLRYLPNGFVAGALISAGTILALVAWLLAVAFRRGN